jgi:hypothetical protein
MTAREIEEANREVTGGCWAAAGKLDIAALMPFLTIHRSSEVP